MNLRKSHRQPRERKEMKSIGIIHSSLEEKRGAASCASTLVTASLEMKSRLAAASRGDLLNRCYASRKLAWLLRR